MRQRIVLQSLSGGGKDCSSDGLQGKDLFGCAELDCFFGHPEDYTSFFVLCDGLRACLAHLEHAPGAVVAHAGEDDADGVLAGVACGRTKEYVDRGTMAADERPLLHLDKVACSAAAQQHVVIAGSDEGATPDDGVVRFR